MLLIHLSFSNSYEEFLISRTFIFHNTAYLCQLLFSIIFLWEISQNSKQNTLCFDKVASFKLASWSERTPMMISSSEVCNSFGNSFFYRPPVNQPPEVFYKNSVLKNFALFTGKHLLESLFNKVADLKFCNFIKNRLQSRCFTANIAKF